MEVLAILIFLLWVVAQCVVVSKLGKSGIWLLVGCHVIAFVLAAFITSFGRNMMGWLVGIDCLLILAIGYGALTADSSDDDDKNDKGGGGKGKGKFVRNVAIATVGGYYAGKKFAKA